MKSVQAYVGQNETASIILLLIIGVWFFTNQRFQALLSVIKAPVAGASTIYTGPTTTEPAGSPVPGLVVPVGVTPNPNAPDIHNSVNPGGHNPTVPAS